MPLSDSSLEPLLRLGTVPGVGSGRLGALLRHFGSAERVLQNPALVREVPGLGPEMAARVRDAAGPAGRERVMRALAALKRAGAVVVTPDDLAYPEAFRHLADPPFLLFAAGNLDLLGEPGIGIVGTRSPTAYGRAASAELAGGLAREGYVVVSGMAKGIDAAAHGAALDRGGTTVGVLGTGIEQVYPAENRRLFQRVRESGLLLTEHAPGERPRPGNFPRRNRLIAALSSGVIVVEMALKSGAQHTVTYALEQGREVFAVPGPVGSPVSAGTNQLLKDGARVVTCVEDVLDELSGVEAWGDTTRLRIGGDGVRLGTREAGAEVDADRTGASPAADPAMRASRWGSEGDAGGGCGASGARALRTLGRGAGERAAGARGEPSGPRTGGRGTGDGPPPFGDPYPRGGERHFLAPSAGSLGHRWEALSPDEERVLTALAAGAKHIDQLVDGGAGAVGEVLATLLALELRGAVESLPGKHFRRAG